MTTNRYEAPWTWREWLEIAVTAIGILVVGSILAVMILATVGCYVPATQPPKPPAPMMVSVDLVFCSAPPVDNYCDGPTGASVNVSPYVVTQTGVDGYVFVQNLPLTGVLEIAAQHPDYRDFDSGAGVTVADLYARNQAGYHNFYVLTPKNQHYDPSAVPLDQLARIRGAMWTETLDTPLGPRPGQPSNIAATDFLWNYSDADRLRIVTNLRALGYTHAVVGPLVDSDGYHGAWQPNDWRGANFDRFLDVCEYLWDHGLAPVVFIHPDNWTFEQTRDTFTALLQQPRAQRLIRIVVPHGWEPCKYECSSYTWAAYLAWGRQVLPNALVLLHTVCDVDAPVGTDSRGDDNGHPNAEGWLRVAPFAHGWLTQSCTFENPDGHDDPPFSNFENWTRLFNPSVRGSYVDRFQHGYAGWPTSSAWGQGQPLKVYAGEDFSYPVFWQGKTKEEARRWGDAAMGQGASGYLDGGSVSVGAGPVLWQH